MWIRISNPRSLRLWCVTERNRSILCVHGFIGPFDVPWWSTPKERTLSYQLHFCYLLELVVVWLWYKWGTRNLSQLELSHRFTKQQYLLEPSDTSWHIVAWPGIFVNKQWEKRLSVEHVNESPGLRADECIINKRHKSNYSVLFKRLYDVTLYIQDFKTWWNIAVISTTSTAEKLRPTWPAPSCLDVPVGRALHWHHSSHMGSNPVYPEFFSGFNFTAAEVAYITSMINHVLITFLAIQTDDLSWHSLVKRKSVKHANVI